MQWIRQFVAGGSDWAWQPLCFIPDGDASEDATEVEEFDFAS